jgi:hypothetical protein
MDENLNVKPSGSTRKTRRKLPRVTRLPSRLPPGDLTTEPDEAQVDTSEDELDPSDDEPSPHTEPTADPMSDPQDEPIDGEQLGQSASLDKDGAGANRRFRLVT